ncbi:MAG: AraC family transcriptional regulator [Clostridia bacterium]|nr:AraC family transcriptional regulator [Clostridia bacterium]
MNHQGDITKAVEYIEKSLTKRITIEDIASHIFITPFRLHRIFLAHTGRSIAYYIKKRRLTEAAKTLINSDKSILDIAMEYCYNSQEAFTRAFRNLFEVTPARYRIGKKHKVYCYQYPLSEKNIFYHAQGGISHTPQIILQDEIKLVGITMASSFLENRTIDAWKAFYEICNKLALPIVKGIYSIFIYDSNIKIKEISMQLEFSLIIGIDEKNAQTTPEWFDTYTLPAGKYAVF